MPMIQYPFIDIAVQENVREHFAAGKAVALLSPDVNEIIWANGRGATLFGYGSVYDLLDQGPPANSLLLRQISAVSRKLRNLGDTVSVTVRVASGFRRITVTGSCTLIEVYGQPCVLFYAPSDQTPMTAIDRANSMIDGLDDPDTHLAVVDADGKAIACSHGYKELELTPQTARMLVTMSGADASGLVKRPVPTAKGYLPAAMAKVSADPALHLLFVVEAAAPGTDQPPGEEDGKREAETFGGIPPEVPARPAFDEAIEDVAELQDLPEIDDFAETDPLEIEPVAPLAEQVPQPDLDTERESVLEAKPQHAADVSTAELAPRQPSLIDMESFVFRRDARATRFVWKIDAEGRFCEISEEFAKTVGPHAADITGMPFNDVAGLFHLDPEGKIAELLRKRDTWSGKTIWWPVEGTSLAVPIDLAALPTYTRSRIFDGFRGFGIIRVADAIEDPHAVGLGLGNSPAETAGAQEQAELLDQDLDAQPDVSEDLASAEETSDDEERAEEGSSAVGTETSLSSDADPAPEAESGDPAPPVEDQPLEWPDGERPALRIVGNDREASGKVIPLDQRRKRRETLSPVEQAAFKEIARQLDSFIGRSATGDLEDTPEPPPPSDAIDQETSEIKQEAPASEDAEVVSPTVEVDAEDEVISSPELVSLEDEVTETTTDDAEGYNVDHLAQGEPAAADPDKQPKELKSGLSIHRGRNGLSSEVLDQMPVALLVIAGDELIHGNPEFLRLTGYATLQELAEVGGLDALLQRRDLEGKTDAPGGMVVVRADDEVVPVTARLQSVRFENATALMLALMPVPYLQEADPQASEAQVVTLPTSRAPDQNLRLQVEVDELRAILETATDGVVVIDAEGNIRSMNGAASALFNYDNEEAAGKAFVMLFAHESQKAIMDYLTGLSGHGVASVLNDGREVIGREAAGGFIPLFMTIGRLSSSNGYCAVIRDITQWKRTEEELRSAKRAAETANAHKSEFLAHVSHEVRTPLNAIIGFADLMSSERFGPIGHPRYVEYANDIVRSGRHVLDIVNDLLDISKIEAGEMDLDFAAVDLNEAVSEAVSLVQPQANGQRVIIRTALSYAVPPVVADHRSVKQIALNILSNAIRFTPSGGQIVVSTVYEADGRVVLRVRDTGIGMTRQELETAMKPFRQIAGSTRKRGDGTGLGLPLTKAMADANRADFSIQSKPHEGTLVEIAFPPQRVLAN
ncbi:sensor histidine kinase [Rhizobium halophilum]|uniref:sensor histidine kinase n=1 Tax=Rhizobium halophilum TaxID=2846852 RepID=UPI001EFC7D3B|nr:PAS domain-containing sensor histidine kinase [Rhizobium halophilum]MCF6369595.1 PAS domain S-box protein [Rhizobium halophilum]